jgi:hypothetical protein
VSEGRIAYIVGETGRGEDIAEVRRLEVGKMVAGDHPLADDATEGTPDTGNLQTMDQTGADIAFFREGKNLSFILEAAKSPGIDDAIVILEKSGPFKS